MSNGNRNMIAFLLGLIGGAIAGYLIAKYVSERQVTCPKCGFEIQRGIPCCPNCGIGLRWG
jgi:hypothetical protein